MMRYINDLIMKTVFFFQTVIWYLGESTLLIDLLQFLIVTFDNVHLISVSLLSSMSTSFLQSWLFRQQQNFANLAVTKNICSH